MSKNTTYTIDDLITKASSYINDEKSLDLIKKAYYYARDAHLGQTRKSGGPYITHPLATSVILTTVLFIFTPKAEISGMMLASSVSKLSVTSDWF